MSDRPKATEEKKDRNRLLTRLAEKSVDVLDCFSDQSKEFLIEEIVALKTTLTVDDSVSSTFDAQFQKFSDLCDFLAEGSLLDVPLQCLETIFAVKVLPLLQELYKELSDVTPVVPNRWKAGLSEETYEELKTYLESVPAPSLNILISQKQQVPRKRRRF